MPVVYDPDADLYRGRDEWGEPVCCGVTERECAAALAAYQRGETAGDEGETDGAGA